MNELAILELKKTDERMLKLADEHKRENENHHKKIIELQKKLVDKQRLEPEVKSMTGKMEVMKHITDEEVEAKKKFESIQEDLREKEELESLTLVIKERFTNDELQDARKELIFGLMDNDKTACAHIGVKRIMGELDKKSFGVAVKRRGTSDQKVSEDAIKFAFSWEDHLRDPNWHPFKVITIKEESKEVLNEEDEKIASLKVVCDAIVYNAVVTTLKEMNQYNPTDRFPLLELWNYKENRKATLKGVNFILKQLKT